MKYWLVKQEPDDYSWARLVKDGTTSWTGIRNFQARNNLRAMKKGDPVLFYHSGKEKRVVGTARVAREYYPDPTAAEGDWCAVDLQAMKALRTAVVLAAIKADGLLRQIALLKQSRLSVVPVTKSEFERVLELGGAVL